MALTVKPSFSAGELDPVLHERTTLDKYRSGLKTGRNVVVSKTGSILSRPGRFHFAKTRLDDTLAVIYSPPGSGLILEFQPLYVRVYGLDGTFYGDEAGFFFTEDDLPSLHFETSGIYVYVFCDGKEVEKFDYVSGNFLADTGVFAVHAKPVSSTMTPAGTPAGYLVQYACTLVINGEESFALTDQYSTEVPIAAGQSNIFDVLCLAGTNAGLTELRVYRRPTNAGAYGYIGSTSYFYSSGGNTRATFTDLGQDADYTHSFPTVITPDSEDPIFLLSKTGIIYQQRLLITDTTVDREAIYASRPGFQNNFFRDYPTAADSALKFKAGSSGYARVLRMLDSDGLVVFTTAGIFLSQGQLDPTNISLAKKGKWVINDAIEPLAVPGGCLFVDSSTNSIRNLMLNFNTNVYDGEEMSIYSNHLFKSREISSWNFQEGFFPLLWVVFTDGKFASFTFEFAQAMKAWTRHDSAPSITVESSCGTINPDTTFFVVKKVKDGVTYRYLEYTISRYTPPSYISDDPEFDKNPSIAFMDSVVSYATLLNNSLLNDDVFTLSPTSGAQDWSLDLNLTCGTSGIFTSSGAGAVGAVLRYFDSDGAVYNLTVASRTDDNTLIVTPDVEFPSDAAETARLYLTATTYTGLDHMDDEYVSVIVDGAVVASPNNDIEDYPDVLVTDGSITLPNEMRGAIVHIGRPIVGDVETLDIDTVEQSPTLIESLDVNKLYVKVHESSGLYVGNKFPDDDKVAGMVNLDQYDIDYSQDDEIIANRAQPASTKRVELTLPGDWKSQGRICLRQVDPLHFEILSIIPDCEILKRSDR